MAPAPARPVRPWRAALLLGLGVLALAGCQRREEEPAPAAEAPATGPTVTPADAAAPLNFDSRTSYAEVALRLPEAVVRQPDLHARLYAADVRDLRQFAEGAQADLSEFGGGGMRGYSRTISWSSGAETGKLLSLGREVTEYTGGAHDSLAYSAVLWDKALKAVLQPSALFRAGVNLDTLDQALCAAVNQAKKARDGAIPPVSLDATDTFSCPRAADTPFVLSPSDVPGKAGGLTFLIAPYTVGPWAEGSYQVQVPQTAFRQLLAPAYVDEFAGAPVKAAGEGR
ncbi:MAG TPA: RsiV family protein [Brevundimonas sp.]|jgi:hypothetical protein|uniref:RsiV family protein n=1 Tax=Brevundimonas sp. TaxID=1871086 RepID=UPI002E0F702A|nr:RsiV family protein [Brevundimonas sp.]